LDQHLRFALRGHVLRANPDRLGRRALDCAQRAGRCRLAPDRGRDLGRDALEVVPGVSAVAAAFARAAQITLPWVRTTPLGRPVLPEV
jgi:hypothetical protein